MCTVLFRTHSGARPGRLGWGSTALAPGAVSQHPVCPHSVLPPPGAGARLLYRKLETAFQRRQLLWKHEKEHSQCLCFVFTQPRFSVRCSFGRSLSAPRPTNARQGAGSSPGYRGYHCGEKTSLQEHACGLPSHVTGIPFTGEVEVGLLSDPPETVALGETSARWLTPSS